MGLSLRNLGKKITDIAGGVERQINPFDNGATYSKPNVAPGPSVASQVGRLGQGAYNLALKPVFDFTRGGINDIPRVAADIYHTGLGVGEAIGGNPVAAAGNLNQANNIFHETNFYNRYLKPQDIATQGARGNRQLLSGLAKGVRQGTGQALLDTSMFYAPGAGLAGAAPATSFLGAVGRGALAAAPAGAFQGFGQTLTEDNPTIKSAAKNIAVGAATQGAVGGILGGGGYGVTKAIEGAKGLGQEGFLGLGKSNPKVQALNDKATELNQAREALLSNGVSPNHPSVKANDRAYNAVIKQRDTLSRQINQGGYIGPGKKPKVDLTAKEKAAGKALGMSEAEVAQAKANDITPTVEKSKSPTVKLKNREAAIKAGVPGGLENAPTPIELPSAAGTPKQAVLNSKAVRSLINERVAPAVEAANALSPADHALLDETRTTALSKLAKRAENPEAFIDAAKKAKAYTDYVHALGTGTGQVLGYREKYGAPLLYDLQHEPTAAALAQTEAQLKTSPGYAKARQTGNYVPSLKRLNQNFAQDLTTDARMRGSHISELALAKGLEEAYPGQVAIGNIPRGYTQLQIASGKAISMPDAIAKKLNSRQAAPQVENIALRGYDSLNRGLKYTSLGGGLFHGATTTETVAGQQIASGNILRHPIQNLRLVAGTLSHTVHEANMAKFAEDGTLDNARLAGVTLKPGEILGDANVKVLDRAKGVGSKLISPFHDMVFGRQIPEAKLMIFNQATRGLDPSIPADMAKMRGVASAVNNLGGINRAVEGLTPGTAQKVSRFVLATDFTETKFRKLGDALSKGGPQGTIARQMVIGKVIAAALPGLAVAAAAGKLNSAEDWAKETVKQITDPQVATGFKSPKGYAKVAKLPGTEVSELTRVLTPLFDGSTDKFSGAQHYGTARLAAAPSTIWQVLTNKNYYGEDIVNRDKSGKINVGKTAENVAIARAPIPVQQGVKTFSQHKQSVAEGLTNLGGARVVVDPNDPKYKVVQTHFANEDKFRNSLDTNEQALFSKLHPTTKDSSGNKIFDKTPLMSTSNYADLIAHPDFTAKYQAYQQNEKSHDPLWDLPQKQLQSYLEAQIISKYDPGGDSNTTRQLYARLPKDFLAKREQYFAGLKAQGVNLPEQTNKKPSMPDNLVKFSADYHNLPYGTGQRSAALRSPEGQAYIKWLDQNRLYNNQERADLGLPPLEGPEQRTYGGRTASLDPYKYAVSLNAGGSIRTPSVSVKKAAPLKASRVARAKPRVSLKSSRV